MGRVGSSRGKGERIKALAGGNYPLWKAHIPWEIELKRMDVEEVDFLSFNLVLFYYQMEGA
jgi:hypothetical protein